MKTKLFTSFVFLFLGLVVLSTVLLCIADGHAVIPVPATISSRSAREVRVYLKSQRFGYYEKGRLIFWGPVCTGQVGHETPKGRFSVIEKYDLRPSYKWTKILGRKVYMPLAVQFKGGCFLHVGEVRSQPSSDGCVRVCETDAKRIFQIIRLKDPITITD